MDGAINATPRALGGIERVANDNQSRARFWELARVRTSSPAAEERWQRIERKRSAQTAGGAR